MMIENRPFFSIILPTYNVGKYIDRCIESCIKQTFSNFEVIILDDCGEDDSIEKAKKWLEIDNRIKIIHHEKNLGTFHARATGVNYAQGEYIVFLDPDDTLRSDALDKMFKQVQSNPDVLLYAVKQIPSEKIYQTKRSVPVIESSLEEEKNVKKLLYWNGFAYGTPGKAYKKSILKNALSSIDLSKDIRLVYGEDVLLFAEILVSSKRIASIPDELYFYHNEESSITKVIDIESLQRNAEQLELIIDKLNKSKINAKDKRYIYEIIISRLRYDQLNISNKTYISKKNKFKNYIELLKIKPNLKMFVKFAIFLATFGKKSL